MKILKVIEVPDGETCHYPGLQVVCQECDYIMQKCKLYNKELSIGQNKGSVIPCAYKLPECIQSEVKDDKI